MKIKITTPIHDFLEEYRKNDFTRCHMPGGKGRNYPYDITEIEGADSLYESSGIIAESERNAAAIFGAEKTLYSCSGSTLAIQTMLALAAMSGKKKVTAGRYSHKSLISTAVLMGLEIEWITPGEYLSGRLEAKEVAEKTDSGTAAVFITYTDYLGGICPIEEIARICAEKGVPLLADNAHGAYLTLLGLHPNQLGASMTADSAHKTLPALTGAAYLHICDKRFKEQSKRMMSLFGSSSPSYLILDSLDLCNRHLAENNADAVFEGVKNLKEALKGLGFMLKESDFLRITIDAAESGYSGIELAAMLRKNRVECEYSGKRYVVLLFSTVTRTEELERVFEAMRKIPVLEPIKARESFILKPEQAVSCREAFFAPSETIKVSASCGRVCSGITAPCPPCVPLVMPGEIIDGECVEALKYYGEEDICVCK